MEGARGRPQNNKRENYTAFDRALIRAKEEGKLVQFKLATDEVEKGFICSVDKYFIEIENDEGKEWFGKAMMTRVKVLK